MLIAVSARASDTLCLAILAVDRPRPHQFTLQLQNNCGQAIVTYTVDAAVTYGEGKTEVLHNAMQDFLPMTSVGGWPAGTGPIQPGEQRNSSTWSVQAVNNGLSLTRIVPVITAVVFDNQQALGQETAIDHIFARRHFELAELRRWKGAFDKEKALPSSGSNVFHISSSMEVKTRITLAQTQEEKAAISVVAGAMQALLTRCESSITSQRMTRDSAITAFESSLDDRIRATERNATRVHR